LPIHGDDEMMPASSIHDKLFAVCLILLAALSEDGKPWQFAPTGQKTFLFSRFAVCLLFDAATVKQQYAHITGQKYFARFSANCSVKRQFLVFDRSLMTASQRTASSNSSGNRKDRDR